MHIVTDAVFWILWNALLFDDGDFSHEEALGSSWTTLIRTPYLHRAKLEHFIGSKNFLNLDLYQNFKLVQ